MQSLASPHHERANPPKPALAFRVGVVGHRPNRLQQADLAVLASVIRSILSIIKKQVIEFGACHPSLFDDSPPILRAITPLAEGSDRIFAEQALQLEFELCCPMPFFQQEYEKDFAPEMALEPNSLARFRRILDDARQKKSLSVFELDGSHGNRGQAYGTCGRVVLNQSDLLIVVWDGEKQGKPGGTEETLAEAQYHGMPVVWINACKPHDWAVLDPDGSMEKGSKAENEHARLAEVVNAGLSVPQPAQLSGADEKEVSSKNETSPMIALDDYYREKRKKWTSGIWWKCFRDLFGEGLWPKPIIIIPDFEKAVQNEWTLPESDPLRESVHFLHPFYAWADKLAVYYSDIYRSAFITSFFLAATAVGLALLPIALGIPYGSLHYREAALTVAELLAILWILISVRLGYKKRWHERWIDYRMIAELIRHLRLMVPLGGGRPFPQVAAHLATYGNPAATWMAWYVRAIERELGLPSAQLNGAHLDRCRSHLSDLLKSQIDFHAITSRRCRKIERRLHVGTLWLMCLTLLACAAHLVPSLSFGIGTPPQLPRLVIFLCGFLPALGAAFAGINNQGEFRRLAKRSAAMYEELSKLRDELDPPLPAVAAIHSAARLSRISLRAARLMADEVMDWLVVFKDKPLVE